MARRSIVIRPATLRDASFVTANMRRQDEVELLCQVKPGTKRHELAYFLVMSGDAFCAAIDDLPVMIFGASPVNAATVSAWAVGTKHTWRVVSHVTRFMREEYLPKLREEGYVAMEARSHVNHATAHRWMQDTGARVVSEPFTYGLGGEKFILFHWDAERSAA